MSPAKPTFTGGPNIAMKVPPHQWEETVSFYRDVIGLPVSEEQIDAPIPSVGFEFGQGTLWIDRVDAVSQAELWLELRADDPDTAAAHLREADIARRDEIEALPDGSTGFWIANPASIIHLVSAR